MKQFYENIVISMFCNQAGYIKEKEACETTWVKTLNQDKYLHFFYTSTNKETYIDKNIIYIKCGDARQNTYDKTVLAIKYIIDNYDFKNIIKTNCSTYINTKILDQVIDYKNKKDNDSIYCTRLHICDWGYFTRGDFNIIPYQYCKDLIEYYNVTKSIIKTGADDLFQCYTWQLKYGKNIGYKYKTIQTYEPYNKYNYNKLKNCCQIRTKINENTHTSIIIMKELHDKIIHEKNKFIFNPIFNQMEVTNRFENKYKKRNISYIQSMDLYKNISGNLYNTEYKKRLFSLIPNNLQYYQHIFIYDPAQKMNEARNAWNKFDFFKKHNCYTKSPELYTGYRANQHHWTTTWCWNNIIPYLYKEIFKKDIDKNNYKLIDNFEGKFNLSYHEFNTNNINFTFIDYDSGYTVSGNQVILRNTNNTVRIEENLSRYHRLFVGAHHTCKIINNTIDINIKLLLNCDSMAIPIIPIFANYFKEILILDNRANVSHEQIIKDFNPTYYLCIFQSTAYYKFNKHLINLK